MFGLENADVPFVGGEDAAPGGKANGLTECSRPWTA